MFLAFNSFVGGHADHDAMMEHAPILNTFLWRALVLNAVCMAMPEDVDGRNGENMGRMDVCTKRR